jgi:AcrR family transcriptional regulator
MTETYHHGNLRNMLIDEGIKTLCHDGVGSFSLRDLSKKIGVSHTAAYRHFPSKEALLRAILAEFSARFRNALISSVEPGITGKEALMQLGIGYVRFFLSQPELVTLFALVHDGGDLFSRILGEAPASCEKEMDTPAESAGETAQTGTASGFGFFSQTALAIRNEEPYQSLSDREILLGFWGKVHGIATILVTQRNFIAPENLDATIERVVRTAF